MRTPRSRAERRSHQRVAITRAGASRFPARAIPDRTGRLRRARHTSARRGCRSQVWAAIPRCSRKAVPPAWHPSGYAAASDGFSELVDGIRLAPSTDTPTYRAIAADPAISPAPGTFAFDAATLKRSAAKAPDPSRCSAAIVRLTLSAVPHYRTIRLTTPAPLFSNAPGDELAQSRAERPALRSAAISPCRNFTA